MLRALPLLLLALAPASGAAAQSRPFVGDGKPMHDSAGRAFAYSAAATAGGLGLGYVLAQVLPEGDPTQSAFAPRDVGYLVMALGGVGGPMVGNYTLGAMDDVGTGLTIRLVGLGVASAGVMGALVLAISSFGQPQDCELACGVVLGTIVGGLAGGLVGGAVYDFATIPGNAREARERLGERQRQALRLGLGAHDGVPVLALRLGL